jgi:hypothetical protein
MSMSAIANTEELMEQIDNLIVRLQEIRNHLKWIVRGEKGWQTEGLKVEGIPERIEQAYNEVYKSENVELLRRLFPGVNLPDRAKQKHFKLERVG